MWEKSNSHKVGILAPKPGRDNRGKPRFAGIDSIGNGRWWAMKKRGKVLRDTTSGPGLIMLEGQQYRFSREGVWKSEAPPKPGLVVDVELDAHGEVQAITVVPASQLAREHAASQLKERNAAASLLATVGVTNLAAGGLLAAVWFLMPAISIQAPFAERLEFTFWQLLGLLRASTFQVLMDGGESPGAGLYGFVAIVALAGPFFHCLWKDKRAFLGGLLPLAFMIVAGIAIRHSLQTALATRNATYTATSTAVSIGLGTYISILVGLYFAVVSARALASTRAGSGRQMNSPQQKAA